MSGWGCKITQAYRGGLKVSLQIENLLRIISELQEQVPFARAIVTNLGYVLSDALVSLTKGLIPASLLPPPQIRDIVSKMEQTGWFPAISKSEMSAYYEFELVKSAEITSQGLHIELEIPFHHTYAKYQVYRTVAIPQPLNSGRTATVYNFQKEYFVVSPRQEFFGELDRSELVKCRGTDRLRFCKNPFALTRSAKSSCVSSLFLDQKTDAMKLCPQKIIPLPANPSAQYLKRSIFLLQSENNNYHLLNVTMDTRAGQIPGCRVCLVQPPCNGHLELPSGGLILHPEPEVCSVDTGKITNIQLPGILQEMFDHVEKQFPLAPAPERDHIKSEIFKAVKLTLNHLPDENIDAEKLLQLAEPFIQHQKIQRQDYSEKLMQHGIVPFNSFIFLAILLAVGLGVACGHWKLLGRRRLFLANKLKQDSPTVERVTFSKSNEKEEPVVELPTGKLDFYPKI